LIREMHLLEFGEFLDVSRGKTIENLRRIFMKIAFLFTELIRNWEKKINNLYFWN
jgi:hypothetical protein